MYDTDMAVFFGVVFRYTPQSARIGITTIKPQSTPINRTYPAIRFDRIIEDTQKLTTTNVYTRITPLAIEPQPGKRGLEKDSAGSSVLWCDLDCYNDKDHGIEALKAFQLPPTLIVDSGGGLHAYWLLNEFATDLIAIKARNKALYKALATIEGDACFDLARVLRVPGTFNVKYDPPVAAKIVAYEPTNVYRLEQFPTCDVEEPTIQVWDHAPLPGGFAVNVQSADKKLYMFLTNQSKAAEMFGTDTGELDRSTCDAWCVTRLLSLGYTPEQCFSVMTDSRYTTSLKYRETGRFDYVTVTINNVYNHFLQSPDRYFDKSRVNTTKLVQEIVGSQSQYIHTAGTFWRYDSGCYRRDAETILKRELTNRLKNRWSTFAENEVLGYIESKYTTPIDTCNIQSHEYINCTNGMLNIATGQIEPHDLKYRSLYQIPASYDPHCDTTVVDNFLAAVIPKDAILFFWEFIGSCFVTDRYWPKAFLTLVGAPDSGKSTLLNFIRALLGDENTESIPLQTLADNRFAMIKLFGRLANIFADLDESAAGNVGQIKSLTGDDKQYAEEKHVKGFSFTNRARLIFSANSYPMVKNADHAYYERAKIVPCPYSYPIGVGDPTLLQRLTRPENLSAALLRAYQGLKRLTAQNHFTASRSMEQAHIEYREYADTVAGFLLLCRYDQTFVTAKEDLYRAYKEYCLFSGRKAVTDQSFYRRIHERMGDFPISEKRPSIDVGGAQKRLWVYTGVKPPEDYVTFRIAKGVNS